MTRVEFKLTMPRRRAGIRHAASAHDVRPTRDRDYAIAKPALT